MGYIGVQPTDTYLSIASQQITGTGSATYTLNYSVSNEEDVAVFVNNVRQNVSSYTVSGTSLTLGGTISSSDSCWVLFLGRTVGTKTPAVGSVTNDMLAGSIANAKLANSSITLNGSAVSLGGSATITEGITMADQWRLTTNLTIVTGEAVITSNLEQVDTSPQGTLGSAMTQSSGIFTFPSTGYYLVRFIAKIRAPSGDGNVRAVIQTTTNNSTYTEIGKGEDTVHNTYHSFGGTVCETLLDITDTSNQKIRFLLGGGDGSNVIAYGSSTANNTNFTFIRLGDT